MIAILGSGFGLYGYLPALTGGCGQNVVLPEKYRSRLSERPELSPFTDRVQWAEDEAAALRSADGVVIALRPSDQAEWASECLTLSNLKYLLLEKPLASSPEAAATLDYELDRSRKVIRVGYTFAYTAWGRQLLDACPRTREKARLSIEWSFPAHYHTFDLRNWKRFTASGGGAIRFYGIQLIALLAKIGYCDVIFSRSFGPSAEELFRWTALFEGPTLPQCEIMVDTTAPVGKFCVDLQPRNGPRLDGFLLEQSDPFASRAEAGQSEELDRRVPILVELCRTAWQPSMDESSWYKATIDLWRVTEEKTRFEMSGEKMVGT